MPMLETSPPDIFDCQTCGACCAYQADWPRFSMETDEEIAKIPENFIAADLSGMRFEAGRCTALTGELGKHVGCAVYANRPHVCRTCMPGIPNASWPARPWVCRSIPCRMWRCILVFSHHHRNHVKMSQDG